MSFAADSNLLFSGNSASHCMASSSALARISCFSVILPSCGIRNFVVILIIPQRGLFIRALAGEYSGEPSGWYQSRSIGDAGMEKMIADLLAIIEKNGFEAREVVRCMRRKDGWYASIAKEGGAKLADVDKFFTEAGWKIHVINSSKPQTGEFRMWLKPAVKGRWFRKSLSKTPEIAEARAAQLAAEALYENEGGGNG
jgi:hypothetical protein